MATGFRAESARAWYETNRPTFVEPTTWYYIDAVNGNDANDGSQGSPFQTLTKAQGSHLGGGRVGAPGVGFYLKGMFTSQAIFPAIECTATAWAVFKVWPGERATVQATQSGSFDPYSAYLTGRPYVWIEGITLDGLQSGNRYAVYGAPNGGTYATNIVLLNCRIYGEVVLIGGSDCWMEGCVQDRAGSNGLPMGPTSQCATAALAGAGAGNVNAGAHSYLVQFTITNSPSSTEGTTEYSLVGTYNGDLAQRSNAVTTTAGDGRVNLTGIAVSTNPYCTARRLYRTSAGADPTVIGNYKLLATIADNTTTTYADNIADGSLGAVIDSAPWALGNSGDGIALVCDGTAACSRTVLYNNRIGDCGHIAVSVGFAGAVTTHQDIRIAFNRVRNRWTGGIAVAYCEGTIIEGNDVIDAGKNYLTEPRWVQTTQGLIANGDATICRYNRVTGCYGQAIAIYGNAQGATQNARRAKIYFNLCEGNYGHGLLLYGFSTGDVSNCDIANNIFAGNCVNGLTSQNATHGYYSGALYEIWVYVTSVDSSLIAGWWDAGTSTKRLNGNTIRSNQIGTTPEAMVWVGGAYGGTQTLTLAQAEAAFGTAFTSQSASDPLLSVTDERLTTWGQIPSTSPARDTGVVLDGYGYEGTAPDRGVFEYGAPSSATGYLLGVYRSQ